MDIKNKATRINLFSLKTVQMRTFHTTWFAFFLAFSVGLELRHLWRLCAKI